MYRVTIRADSPSRNSDTKANYTPSVKNQKSSNEFSQIVFPLLYELHLRGRRGIVEVAYSMPIYKKLSIATT
jgi:hypothetical protein